MNLKVGEQVFVIDDDLKGTVLSFSESTVTFCCDDEFDYTYPIEQVYKVNKEGNVEKKNTPITFSENVKAKIFKSESNFQLKFDLKNPVVDLHIEKLDRSKLSLPDYEILEFQMSVVRELIFQANRKRIRKLVLIHGVGAGKLRSTLRNFIKESHPEIEYLDGNYQKYGGGATELIIHQFD